MALRQPGAVSHASASCQGVERKEGRWRRGRLASAKHMTASLGARTCLGAPRHVRGTH